MLSSLYNSGCPSCGPGGRFAHVTNAGEGAAHFRKHCQDNVMQMLQQGQGLAKWDAQAFMDQNMDFIVKRLKYDDVNSMRTVECSCVIMAPQLRRMASKVPRVHVRMTYYSHTGKLLSPDCVEVTLIFLLCTARNKSHPHFLRKAVCSMLFMTDIRSGTHQQLYAACRSNV